MGSWSFPANFWLVLCGFLELLGGISGGSRQVLFDFLWILGECAAGSWRFSSQLVLDSIFGALGDLRLPKWSQDGPKGSHREAKSPPKNNAKTKPFLQSIFGCSPGCKHKSFSSQFGSILDAFGSQKSVPNQCKNLMDFLFDF